MGSLALAWSPPPRQSVSEWANANRRLSPESAAEPGQWDTDRVPYLRGIMDATNDPNIHTIVVMSSAQVGKTEAINNVVGYHIDLAPCPMLLVYPTGETAEDYSKDRLAPMIRDTPCLDAKVRDVKSRSSNNTLRKKMFPGGLLTLVGANAPAGLRSKPIKIVLFDEVDSFPASAGTEGDPVDLAIKRTTTFWDRKIVMVSTPGIKGVSRIEKAWKESNQQRYFVPCPHCHKFIHLVWSCVTWDKGKPEMLLAGQWRPTWKTDEGADPQEGVAGFHLNELYAPWANTTFGDVAKAHVKAVRKGAETLKVWVNTSLGETWEAEGDSVDWEILHNRREQWNGLVPEGVAFLTAGVDIQKDRIELEVVGWGIDDESWSVDYRVLIGDTESPEVWDQLDRALLETYTHATGNELTISATGVDSGYKTDKVHAFCLKRWSRNVFAVKGEAGASKPLFVRPARPKPGKCPLFRVGVDTAKDSLYDRLNHTDPGPGYCHFPMERTEDYFRQLTVEKQITKYSHGHGMKVWIKPSGARNEALDCRNYATAAAGIFNPDIKGILDMLHGREVKKVQTRRRVRARF
jgi:phage terminase large subunit GpA-like protein